MRLTLINLDRSTDRLRQFTAVNAHLRDVERFSAVDGQKLTREELRANGLMIGEPEYPMPTLGIFLSHRALWDRTIETEQPHTVFEDDAIVSRDFEAAQRRLLDAAGPGWDFILWGWNFDAYLWVDLLPGVSPAVIQTFQDRLRRGVADFQDQRPHRCLLKLLHFFGLVSYSVSPAGARRLRDYCFPLRPMRIEFASFDVAVVTKGVDRTMNGVVSQMNSYVCVPPLVITENLADSGSSRRSMVTGGASSASLKPD